VTRAVVVGGGIGGLCATRALRRAGVDATCFERAPEFSKIRVGGGIHVWHNGMRGLGRLGLAEQVEALGGRAAAVERMEMRNWRGKLLATVPVDQIEEEVGAPTMGVRRPELHEVLAGGLDSDAVELGATCTGFSQNDGEVVVQFDAGREERADLLVGADGLHSIVRKGLRGDEPPRFAKYASWQALCEFSDDAAPVGLFWIIWGPGARFLFYRTSAKHVYWEGIFATEAGGTDPEGARKQAVLDRFRGWVHPVEAIVAATDESAIGRTDVYDRKPIKQWGAGRVTLLGDAAHPMTNAAGQGANQAIEDAVVLGSRLEGATDVVAALRAYERERAPRAAKFAKLAWNLTALSRWRHPAALAARDRLVPIMMVAGKRAQRKDMAYEF
jgi:2-polyprenyl-6-methoxyphenol hydroxylase-like FAD-dependent oxidoreductase